jgi:competence protein ComEC
MTPTGRGGQRVVEPVAAKTLRAGERTPGSLVNAMRADPQALAYFLLNVGDGDTQLIVLPPDSSDRRRRLVIVDVATRGKLPSLLDSLFQAGVLCEPPGSPGQIRLMVATHPHHDHIGGMNELVGLYNGPSGCIDQFWDPGYYFPGLSFHNLMRQLEASPWIRRLQPTSGTRLYLDSVKVTAVGPGVGLRTRFDTYGVGVNDASLTLMVEYPAARILTEPDPADPSRRNRRVVNRRSRRLLLGADAQFSSWAQATIDFPDLAQQQNPALVRELRAARGRDYLAADVFKLPHHASKHGITLELLERVGARHVLVSSTAGGGRYNFPHALAMEAAREARQATTSSGAQRLTDHELGIYLTGSRFRSGSSLGSIAVLLPRSTGDVRLFRLMDEPSEPIDLLLAREVVT